MRGLDGVEGREVKVGEERLVVHHGGMGGVGGAGGRRGRAGEEGAERGGIGDGEKEQAVGCSARVSGGACRAMWMERERGVDGRRERAEIEERYVDDAV